LAVWWAAARYGIDGVAAVWAARAGLDALALFVAAHLALPKGPLPDARVGMGTAAALVPLGAFLAGAWLTARAGPQSVAMRLAMLSFLLVALIAWEWALLLGRDDRRNFKELCTRLLTTQAR
jgi:hypothetical protein